MPRKLVPLSLCLLACGTSPPGGPLRHEVVEAYAELLHAGYSDAVVDATELRTALAPLIAGTGTAADLEAAREAWTASRRHYMQTEYARFVDGPIDGPDLGEREIRINAWPLDEATIDYVRAGPGDPPMSVGIVNTPGAGEITRETLAAANMSPAEQNVTIGWHAIEFLLWGQDFASDGPGDRSIDDFTTAANADRRRAYLDVVSQMLIDDLTAVRDEWARDRPGSYREQFLAMPADEALGLILTAWGRFAVGELSGQRLEEALITRDQEDEHSCFSDTTLLDHADDVRSLSNLYLAEYVRADGTLVSGPSLADLVAARDPALDASIRAQLALATDGVEGLAGTPGCAEPALEGACPFDQLVANEAGRSAVNDVVRAVRDLGPRITSVATLLGVTIDISPD